MGKDFGKDTTAPAEFTGATADTLTGSGAATKLRMQPSPNFLYCHHPERWQIMDGEVLPVLHRLDRDPGVSNVSPKNGGDMSPAIGLKVRNGWTMIPHDVIPGGYVRKFDGAFGSVHLTKWETPRQHGLRSYDPKVDVPGFRAFLRDLLERGVIQPPPEHVLEILVERARACVERAAPHTATKSGQAVYDRTMEELRAVEAACGLNPPAPKPKPRKRKRVVKKPAPKEGPGG